MGTPANINVKVGDTYQSATVNYDGYPSHVGLMLVTKFNSQKRAESLVAPGDFSAIEDDIAQIDYYYESDSEMKVTDEPIKEESYSYTWDGMQWLVTGHEYDDEENMVEWNDEVLTKVLGILTEDVSPKQQETLNESEKALKYFGCSVDEVIEINNEWLAQFNTPDERFTDSYNNRVRWSVRHRQAPYQGMDEDGIWHHTFFGRTLLEAVEKGKEYLQRGQDFEDSIH